MFVLCFFYPITKEKMMEYFDEIHFSTHEAVHSIDESHSGLVTEIIPPL